MSSNISLDTFKDFPPIQKAIKLSTALVCDQSARNVQECVDQLKHAVYSQIMEPSRDEKPHHWPTLWAHMKFCMNDLKYWEMGAGHPADRLSDSYIRLGLLRLFFEVGGLSRKKLLEGIITDILEIQAVVERMKDKN
ncbi:23980_t:CDS:1 [Dentiscutata erythropus]|uniref:23980_t:CDS:1 n=1 Tax=Dentiscutata erythropus TaxID=1348616 RepID=A0A9N9DTU1_9GLOM|nr:23980_t:CDS:1 [Dentiscutata erythropus]